MKKKNLKSLSLKKNVISNLNQNRITGGTTLTYISCWCTVGPCGDTENSACCPPKK